MEYELAQLTSQIKPLDKEWLARAQERLDSLTKPQGSLGRLEELAAKYVAIREEMFPPPWKSSGWWCLPGTTAWWSKKSVPTPRK